MEKDNRQTPEEKFRYYSGAIRRDMGNLLKWLLLAVVVGCIAGAFSTLFSFVLKAVTARHICGPFFSCPCSDFASYFFMRNSEKTMAARIKSFLQSVPRMMCPGDPVR